MGALTRIWLIVMVLLVAGHVAHAAVSFDAANSSSITNDTALAWSHTVGGGCTNPILLICVNWQDATLTQSPSVTYDSVGATLIAAITNTSAGDFRTEFWRLVAPTTGSSQTVSVTLPDTMNSVAGGSASYCGVDQATPLGTPASAAVDNTPVTVDVSSASGELVVDCASSKIETIEADPSQQERVNVDASGEANVGMSEEAGAATVTMSWTQTPGTQYWATVGVALKPAAAAPSVRPAGPIIFGKLWPWLRVLYE
jgi:hypothetical protein